MKLRRLFHLGLNGGAPRRPPVISYNPVHKARCPFCHSLATIYIPVIAEGHCDSCGKSWRFLADPDAGFDRPTIRPRRIDYNDLVGFCLAMIRLRVGRREARERYAKLGIVTPEEETWERAWRDAEAMA